MNQHRGPAGDDSSHGTPAAGLAGLLQRQPWLVFVLPLFIYLVLGQFEPKPPPATEAAGAARPAEAGEQNNSPTDEDSNGPAWFGLTYPAFYAVRLALTSAATLLVMPGYRAFPIGRWRSLLLAVLVGAAGGVIWVGICKLQIEQTVLAGTWLGDLLGIGSRAAYNPWQDLAGQPTALYGFLAVRLLGLVIIVPIVEEFFLRGFLMRFVIEPDRWSSVPFGTVTLTAVATATAYGVLTHPEIIAAGVWFTLITGLMAMTRNMWDCIAAHATTNLVLGVYVMISGDWGLW